MRRSRQHLGTDVGRGRLLVEPPVQVRYSFDVYQWMIEDLPGTLDIEGALWMTSGPQSALVAAYASDGPVDLELADGARVGVLLFDLDNLASPHHASVRVSGGDQYFIEKFGQRS